MTNSLIPSSDRTPDINGMSGCRIWYNNQNKILLVGVIIERITQIGH